MQAVGSGHAEAVLAVLALDPKASAFGGYRTQHLGNPHEYFEGGCVLYKCVHHSQSNQCIDI